MLWWTLRQLKSKDPDKRWQAVDKLGESKDTRLVGPLITMTRDSNSDVRKRAVVALGQIGDMCSLEGLVAALKDNDWEVQKVAAEALQSVGWQPTNEAQLAIFAVAFGKWGEAIRIGAEAVTYLLSTHGSRE